MWQLKIEDPSGETRLLALRGTTTLGRAEDCHVLLRDPTVPAQAATLIPSRKSPSNCWIRVAKEMPSCLLGDLPIRESQVPPGVPVVLGETRITLQLRSKDDPQPEQPSGVRHWMTCSPRGMDLLWMAKKSAATPLSLYLAGETGTGKEVLAHLLHAWSDRASGPFVPLHCGALPLSLIESELFGHVKGAFTGASQPRAGALMQAHNGTLFLDEVGDLPMDIQMKLLRFLENGEIRPVGADRVVHADVRLVCATHHPLQKLVEEGKFRRDLYYRLASVTLEITPLRERPEDIELLAQTFAGELGRTLSEGAILRLKAHAWPGNVRELRHAVERAAGLAGPFAVTLPEEAFDFLLTSKNVAVSPQLELGVPILKLDEMERILILRALKIANGNRSHAAKILGIARSTLFEMLKRHKIIGPRDPGDQLTIKLEKKTS